MSGLYGTEKSRLDTAFNEDGKLDNVRELTLGKIIGIDKMPYFHGFNYLLFFSSPPAAAESVVLPGGPPFPFMPAGGPSDLKNISRGRSAARSVSAFPPPCTAKAPPE